MAYILCVKATSQTTIYENNKEMMAGCVYYKAGDIDIFPVNTAIQPDNPHPIPHEHLVQCHENNSLTILGVMPEDFHQKLTTAIQSSTTLTAVRKQKWLARLS